MGICNSRTEMSGNLRTRHGHGNSKWWFIYIHMHLESYKANTLVLSWKRSKKEGYI